MIKVVIYDQPQLAELCLLSITFLLLLLSTEMVEETLLVNLDLNGHRDFH